MKYSILLVFGLILISIATVSSQCPPSKPARLTDKCLCPPKYFDDGENFQCQQCDQSLCQECTSKTQCTVCKDESFKPPECKIKVCKTKGYVYRGGRCIKTKCLRNQYKSLFIGSKCLNCRNRCDECVGYKGNCLECKNKSLLPPLCLDIFPDNCKKDEFKSLLGCKKCQTKCLECKGMNSFCTKCKDENAKPPLCITVKTCEKGEFYRKQQCQKCDDKCETCVLNNRNCLKCANNLYLPPLCIKLKFDGEQQDGEEIDGEYFDGENIFELPKLPPFFPPSLICSKKCEKCDLKDSSKCTTCRDPKTRTPAPQCDCKPGYSNILGNCKKCDDRCSECLSPKLCTKCKNSDAEPPLCLEQVKCPKNCKYCSRENPEKCHLCEFSNPFRILSKNCECPKGFVDSEENPGQCVKSAEFSCENHSNLVKCSLDSECIWAVNQCVSQNCASQLQKIDFADLKQQQHSFDGETQQFTTILSLSNSQDEEDEKTISQDCLSVEVHKFLENVESLQNTKTLNYHFDEESQQLELSWGLSDMNEVCVLDVAEDAEEEKKENDGEETIPVYICGFNLALFQGTRFEISWNISYEIKFDINQQGKIDFIPLGIEKEFSYKNGKLTDSSVGLISKFLETKDGESVEQKPLEEGEKFEVQQGLLNRFFKKFFKVEFEYAKLFKEGNNVDYSTILPEEIKTSEQDGSSAIFSFEGFGQGDYILEIVSKVVKKQNYEKLQQLFGRKLQEVSEQEGEQEEKTQEEIETEMKETLARRIESKLQVKVIDKIFGISDGENASQLLSFGISLLSLLMILFI